MAGEERPPQWPPLQPVMELIGDSKISPIGLGSGHELHGKEEEATLSPLWGLA
jgi:hypothetical protein